jgi:hypothetical protein
MRRDPQENLPLFNLYVDEAHELSGIELRELLAGMRKFAVGVTLANQSIDDFCPAVRESILGCVETHVVLRQGLASAVTLEPLVQPRFDANDLMRLADFTAIARTRRGGRYAAPQRIRLAPQLRSCSASQARLLRRASAERYGRPRAEIEAHFLRIVDGEE